MNKMKKFLMLTLILSMIVCICGCQKKVEKESITTTEVETITEDPNEGKSVSKLTGEYVKEARAKRRPIAMMYNNIIDAIPHSGLSNADVCYEAPVEGSITRIMGIFDNYSNLEKMGSVRSSRIYYCYFALEFDAFYCHFGQSKYAVDFLKSGNIDTVGTFTAGHSYYRTSDRVAPHNCFISGEAINEAIDDLGYRKNYEDDFESKFTFTEPGTKVELDSDKSATMVELGYRINKPWFEYNTNDNQYYRYQYGDKHIDDQNNEQLHCSNIIIQNVSSSIYPDGKSLDITLTGSGEGWFITGGKAQKITWKKEDSMGQTKYYDKDGNEITLNTGKTWICIVQNEYADEVVIK